VNGDEIGGVGVETAIRVQPVVDLRDWEIGWGCGGRQRDINSLEAVVTTEVLMMIGFEDLGSTLGQADGRDDAGVFEITVVVSGPMISMIVFLRALGSYFGLSTDRRTS
jgi:hypothetical protein